MYTKGPWNISKHGTPDYAPQYGIYTDDNDFCIVTGQDAEANARLIAAAPELLEALELTLATVDRLANTQAKIDSVQGTLSVATEAIRKAKGE